MTICGWKHRHSGYTGTLASMRLLAYILLSITILTGCSKNNEGHKQYQVYVDYSYDSTRNNRPSDRLSENTLYLFFEEYFQKDTIDVYLNKSDYSYHRIVSTTEMLGIADLFEFKNIEAIHTIRIRMNSGPELLINTNDKDKNIWWVGYWSDTLRAQALRNPPTYE